MMLLNRRSFLLGATGLPLATSGLSAYAVGVEPVLMLDVTSYALTPPGWPDDLPLKIAVIADVHACEPWMSAAHIRHICDVTNSLKPDLIVLLGDYNAGHDFVSGPVMPDQWGEVLATLRAPLGIYGILGNHDVWHGALPRMRGDNGESVRAALRGANVRVLDNHAVRVSKDGRGFWLLGLADQLAYRIGRHFDGADDLPGTLRQITDDAPAIMLAHEPYIFPRVPKRISLTLSGHTHGGQVNLPIIGSPVARRESRFVYGHFVENDRHLIVSAGLGASLFPVRFMRPPEIVEITLGGKRAAGVAAAS
ncbi:MAG: metallophosphoesterase [Hyphomicrobiales bacterium]|nr:metallophosphoesterase [Hyphomicrobiales bacterium]